MLKQNYSFYIKSNELNGLHLDEFISIMKAEGMDIRKTVSSPLHHLNLFKYNLDKILPNTINKRIGSDLFHENHGFKNSEKVFESTFSLPTFTFEPYELIDSYIDAFQKVCSYYH